MLRPVLLPAEELPGEEPSTGDGVSADTKASYTVVERRVADLPASVIEAYELAGTTVTPVTIGLINQTWRIERGDEPVCVVQRLHPIFAPEVNEDIDVITAHLARVGMPTPRVIRTRTGARWVEHDGHTFRTLTFVRGRTLTEVGSPAVAAAAGELAGRLHGALSSLTHTFAFGRAGVHDTPAHLAALDAALRGDGALATAAREAGESILEHARALPPLPATRPRIVHGDLKITNLLFHKDRDEGHAVLDLDTFAHGTLPVELGDALRSWCNPAGESRDGGVVPALFEAALRGWARSGTPTDADERDAIVLGLETISIELASRFARDAIEDRYFGWDATKYGSRAEHNRARALSQLALARSIRARRAELERMARTALP